MKFKHSVPTCKTRHAGGMCGLATPKLILCLDTEGVVVVRWQTCHIVAGASDASCQGVPVQVRQVLWHKNFSSIKLLCHQNLLNKVNTILKQECCYAVIVSYCIHVCVCVCVDLTTTKKEKKGKNGCRMTLIQNNNKNPLGLNSLHFDILCCSSCDCFSVSLPSWQIRLHTLMCFHPEQSATWCNHVSQTVLAQLLL